MRRIFELAAFLTLGAVLRTIGFRLYQSPDGKALRAYLGSSQRPVSSDPDWMKQIQTPEWKFEHKPLVPTQDWNLGSGVELPWKPIHSPPGPHTRPVKSSTDSTPAKFWGERMKAHSERIKAHRERVESIRQSRSQRQTPAPATGFQFGENPFAN